MNRLLASLIGVVVLAIMPMAVAQQPEPNGWIEGRIFDDQTGQPLVDWVGVLAAPDAGTKVEQTGPTDGEGAYRIGPLPAGTYRLEFVDARLQGYLTEWWQDQPDAASADVVEVADGQVVSGIDFFVGMAVDEGGWITGVATDAETGDPVSTISLIVFDLDGNRVDQQRDLGQFSFRSGADGVYRVGNLGTGSFKLQFEDSGNFVYQPAWYGGTDFENAAIINVTLGVEASGIDISLTLADTAEPPPADEPPPAVGPPAQVLPFTGLATKSIAVIGFGALLLGLGLIVATTMARPEIDRL